MTYQAKACGVRRSSTTAMIVDGDKPPFALDCLQVRKEHQAHLHQLAEKKLSAVQKQQELQEPPNPAGDLPVATGTPSAAAEGPAQKQQTSSPSRG